MKLLRKGVFLELLLGKVLQKKKFRTCTNNFHWVKLFSLHPEKGRKKEQLESVVCYVLHILLVLSSLKFSNQLFLGKEGICSAILPMIVGYSLHPKTLFVLAFLNTKLLICT